MRKRTKKEKERRNEKIKRAVVTAVIFGLIGVLVWGGVLITQNVSAIIGKFMDIPPEAFTSFVAGAIALKIAQILRLYLSMWSRAKRAKKAGSDDVSGVRTNTPFGVGETLVSSESSRKEIST